MTPEDTALLSLWIILLILMAWGVERMFYEKEE